MRITLLRYLPKLRLAVKLELMDGVIRAGSVTVCASEDEGARWVRELEAPATMVWGWKARELEAPATME